MRHIKIRSLVMTAIFAVGMAACSSVDEPESRQEDSGDPLHSMLRDFYNSVKPLSRTTGTFRVTGIERHYYQKAGDSIIAVIPTKGTDIQTDGNDSVFEISTVSLRFDDTDGYAVLSQSSGINRIFYFTDNGTPTDTSAIAPLKEYIENIPAIASDYRSYAKTNTRTGSNDFTVLPLVGCKWGQWAPFNLYTPECNCSSCDGHVPTGCVTTATAQFLRTVPGFKGTFYGSRLLYSIPYTESEMSDTQKQLIAQAFHEIALNCQVRMQCGGSGSKIKAAYRYLSDMGYVGLYEEKGIDIERLKTELLLHIPHLIAGNDSKGGHMWIIDGIRASGNSYEFHCNWGYYGTSDGWCYGNPYTSYDKKHSLTKNIRNIYITLLPTTI